MVARDVELRGIRSAAFTLAAPAGEARVELPLPGLYNVYNALGAAALSLQLGAPLDAVVAGLEGVAPAFGRAETVDLGGRPTSILLVKNPAGANEVLRTLSLEAEQLDLFGVLNDNTADGRDISWVWDADWELLAPSVRRMTCSGTRAAELALRMKYAGVEGGSAARRPAARRRPRRRARRRRRPALRAAHLHGAARAARPARPPRPGRGALAMSFSPLVVWHDIECGQYSADLELWDELAAREPGPVLDVGAGTGRVSLVLAALGHDVTALDREPELLDALGARRGGERVRTAVADARDFALDRRFGLDPRPDADDPAAAERAGFFAAARAHLAAGGLLAIAIAAALEDFGELDGMAPDTGAVGSWRFESLPVAVRALDTATRIERRRTMVAPDGRITEEDDVIELVNVTVAQLQAEGRAAGLTPERPARSPRPRSTSAARW